MIKRVDQSLRIGVRLEGVVGGSRDPNIHTGWLTWVKILFVESGSEALTLKTQGPKGIVT